MYMYVGSVWMKDVSDRKMGLTKSRFSSGTWLFSRKPGRRKRKFRTTKCRLLRNRQNVDLQNIYFWENDKISTFEKTPNCRMTNRWRSKLSSIYILLVNTAGFYFEWQERKSVSKWMYWHNFSQFIYTGKQTGHWGMHGGKIMRGKRVSSCQDKNMRNSWLQAVKQ
jgi:hypothetical protein